MLEGMFVIKCRDCGHNNILKLKDVDEYCTSCGKFIVRDSVIFPSEEEGEGE